jgi:hypothetical protein
LILTVASKNLLYPLPKKFKLFKLFKPFELFESFAAFNCLSLC